MMSASNICARPCCDRGMPRRRAAVGQARRQRRRHPQAGVGRFQQNRAAIRARVGLIERRHERSVEQIREENSLWYRLVSQRKRLRCGEKVPKHGLCTTRGRLCFYGIAVRDELFRLDEAARRGWVVVDMKQEWARIF